ncbi:hypothetical protein ACO22_00689 [Paracoccidioides brasiliensis]|uniref:Uncharacterized protein n=1 Tax=Paracoccidioides brasiliensis TaxID=121759 RepID=A0A1D2JNJ4_PARBR|nr:hypothetical protein ACO22_00689 [Paracoccidioides brasiliensis]
MMAIDSPEEKFPSGQGIVLPNSPFSHSVDVDENYDSDVDSAFSDNDGQSTSTSLESNVMRYRYENGR